MAEDLYHLWRNFSLSEEEGLEVEVNAPVLAGIVHRDRNCLVGTVVWQARWMTSGPVLYGDAVRTTLL
jgi:hypothetical protein